MDRLKLVTIGGGIHAAFYKGGQWIGEGDLGREAEVSVASAEELAEGPKYVPDFAERTGRGFWSSFSGFYVVPDRGLAAIFGAVTATPPSLSLRSPLATWLSGSGGEELCNERIDLKVLH
jgi:hypothetical protein